MVKRDKNGEEQPLNKAEKESLEDRLRSRFYENEYPEMDECVVVEVNSIEDMGAYVSLLEYEGVEGMILLSELSRRRMRSINKHIRVGKIEVRIFFFAIPSLSLSTCCDEIKQINLTFVLPRLHYEEA